MINVVRSIFSEQGIPEVLIGDNGTQFTSAQFQELSKRYIQKGMASSREVQTVKKILLKCEEAGTDLSLALLSLRSTLLSVTLRCPAELLLMEGCSRQHYR